MQLKEVLVFFSIVILLIPFVSAISDVHHSVDGNNVTITYEGTAPFWINIRKDEDIGQDEGYVWAKTNSKAFTIDLGFAINPSKTFYYAVKDTEWSKVQSFVLGDETDKCSDGTLFGKCSSTKPYYCDNSDLTYGGNGILIKNCQKCGCPEQEECQDDGSCKEEIATENKKDLSLYSNKEAFLISDKNWKDVLPLVPVTTWTGSEEQCQRGTGTPDNVCVYPTLIYHEEENNNLYVDLTSPWEEYSIEVWCTKEREAGGGYGEKEVSKSTNLEPGEIIIFKYKIYSENINPYNPFKRVEIVQLPDFLEFVEPADGIIEVVDPNQGIFEFTLKVKDDAVVEWNTGFDADSLIYFMQQYSPDELTAVGETPQELANLFVAEPELGAGLLQEQISSITPEDYLSYWESYKDIVYVEDDYELALLASTYASLINAPLIIKGTQLDSESTFSNKNIICVGSVNPIEAECNKQYSLEQLQQKYVDETNTDKIILVNPNDLNIKVSEPFQPEKTGNIILELYSKTSLASPILASAKHEVIFTANGNYEEIDLALKQNIKNFMPYIINNGKGIKNNNFESPIRRMYKSNINEDYKEEIYLFNSYDDQIAISDSKIIFKDGWLHTYNLKDKSTKKLPIGEGIDFFSISDGKIAYEKFEIDHNSNPKCYINIYDLELGYTTELGEYNYFCILDGVDISGDNVIWLEMEPEGICPISGEICSNYDDCKGSYCSNGYFCEKDSDCQEGSCLSYYCTKKEVLYVYNLINNNKKMITREDYISDIGISQNKVIWQNGSILYIYDTSEENINLVGQNLNYPQIEGGKIIWTNYSSERVYNLYLYDITSSKVSLIANNVEIHYELKPRINNKKIIWFDASREKYCKDIPDKSCNNPSDCGYCISTHEECQEDSECNAEDHCQFSSCGSTLLYMYDINTNQKKEISEGKVMENPILIDEDFIWQSKEYNDYYIYGFLTVFSSPSAIPIRDNNFTVSNSNYRSLDNSEYGDIYLNDKHPDLSVGRIQGISVSDVSSYLSRDLFFEKIEKTNNIEFLSCSFNYAIKLANNWTIFFNNVGYNAHCSIVPTSTSGTDFICEITYDPINWPELWKNRGLIHYMDHGSGTSAGISSLEIPYLKNSLLFMDACLTCATEEGESFCNRAIRKGAISYIGTVSIAFSGDKIYKRTIDGIYYHNLTIGESFAKSFRYTYQLYMATLLGDPTLNIKPSYNFEEILPWKY